MCLLTDKTWQTLNLLELPTLRTDFRITWSLCCLTRWLWCSGVGGLGGFAWPSLDEVSLSKSELCLRHHQPPMPPLFASSRRISLGLISFLSRLNLVRADNEGSSPLFFLAVESAFSLAYSNKTPDSPRIHNYFYEGFLDVSDRLN